MGEQGGYVICVCVSSHTLASPGALYSMLGSAGMGATLMDGLDTLFLAGLTEEVAEAEAWLVSNFDVHNGRVCCLA